MKAETVNPLKVFYSYAHRDEALRTELENQLSNLRRQGLVSDWHDRKVSAGAEWTYEVNRNLEAASIILLLISPDFMASDYCNSIEMKRAMEKHKVGEARVVPILLRPTEWKGAPFEGLQFLPANGKPITKWTNRDEAFLDVAKGIGQVVMKLLQDCDEKRDDLHNEKEIIALQRYNEILHERWKKLDFKGILHIDMNRPIGIPLSEIFVLPDLLVGMPKYETLEREDVNEDDAEDEKGGKHQEDDQEQHLSQPRLQYSEKQTILQREDLHTVLARNSRLVILGDPGSGKSTLLRHILLDLTQKNSRLIVTLGESYVVPLYIPLESYADACLSSVLGERSFKDFLPRYFRDNYLDEYIDFIQDRLTQGRVFLLLDGLDEIPDPALRMKVVRQVELFTQSYPNNRFIVTSRIVGYKDAQLAAEYEAYTLADFNEKQIKIFTQRWCPAYELWVKGINDSQYLQNLATKEAERLFHATQSKPAVRRLAANPLLLTILALIQRQGIELPNHRVELFKLCSTTLLDTWIKAKGYVGSTPFSKNDLIKLLRPLAFWMHDRPAVGAIREEELTEQIMRQLLERNVVRHQDEAAKLAEQFLQIVHGQTGILIERGRQRYGFLHLTFEEYFAAEELKKRRDRKKFIKGHLHHPRWEEIILLAVGAVGILDSDEENVTELVQKTILKADSPFESLLYRDLIFAGVCLADDVGVSITCEDDIIERTIDLYITSPYDTVRHLLSRVLILWRDTKVAVKVIKIVLTLLQRWETITGIVPQLDIDSDASLSGLPLGDLLASHQYRLLKEYQEAQVGLLRLRIITTLSHLDIDMTSWLWYILARLSDVDSRVRQAAVIALKHLTGEPSHFIDTLQLPPQDHDPDIRQVLVEVAQEHQRSGNGHPQILAVLLRFLFHPDLSVRKLTAEMVLEHLHTGSGHLEIVKALKIHLFKGALNVKLMAIEAIGYLGSGQAQVVDALLALLLDSNSDIRLAVVNALKYLGSAEVKVFEALISIFSDPDFRIKKAAVDVLVTLRHGQPQIVDILLENLYLSNWQQRQMVVMALGELGNGQTQVIDSLIPFLADPNTLVRRTTADALGKLINVGLLRSGEPRAIDVWLKLLSIMSIDAEEIATAVLMQLGDRPPQSVDSLLKLLSDRNGNLREKQKAFVTLSEMHCKQLNVIDPLLRIFSDTSANLQMRLNAAMALGQAGRGSPYVINRLLKLLLDSNADLEVRLNAAMALGQADRGLPDVVDRLLKLLLDANVDLQVKQATVEALGQMGSKEPEVIDTLLKLLANSDFIITRSIIEALKKMGEEQPYVVSYLKIVLSDTLTADVSKKIGLLEKSLEYKYGLSRDLVVRQLELLKQIGNGQSQYVEPLLPYLSNSDQHVRQTAIEALSQLTAGQPRFVNLLLNLLSDTSSGVRQSAAEALGRLANEQPEIVDVLLRLLSNPDWRIKQAAAESLGQINRALPQVVNGLIELFFDPDAHIRSVAVAALKYLGSKQSEVVDVLLGILSSSDWRVRQAAAEVLGQIDNGRADVVDALLRLLSDADLDVKKASVFALGQVGKGQSQVVDALLALLSDTRLHVLDSKSVVNQAIVRALGQVGEGHLQVIDVLLELVSDSNWQLRQAAVSALGQVGQGQSRVISTLLRLVSNANFQPAVIMALGQVGNSQPRVIDSLLKLLSNPNWQVRQVVASTLGQLGSKHPRIISALLELSSDSDWRVRQNATEALGQVGSSQSRIIDNLLKLLVDSNANVRRVSAMVLGNLRVDRMDVGLRIEKLLKIYGHTDNEQFAREDIADSLLFALQQVVGRIV